MLPKIRKQYAIRKIAHGGGTTLLKVTRNIERYAFSWRVDIKVSFDSTRRSRRILTAFTETRVTVSRLNSKSLEFFHRRKKVRLQSIACRVISQHVTIPSTYRLTFHPIVSNTDTASGLSRWIYRQAHRSRASLSFFHVASAKFPRVHESETRDRSTSMHVETRSRVAGEIISRVPVIFSRAKVVGRRARKCPALLCCSVSCSGLQGGPSDMAAASFLNYRRARNYRLGSNSTEMYY